MYQAKTIKRVLEYAIKYPTVLHTVDEDTLHTLATLIEFNLWERADLFDFYNDDESKSE